MGTHFKPYCTPNPRSLQRVTHREQGKAFIVRGEALRLFRTNYSDKIFEEKINTFLTQNNPAVPHLKEILATTWFIIQQKPLLSQIFKELKLLSSSVWLPTLCTLTNWRWQIFFSVESGCEFEGDYSETRKPTVVFINIFRQWTTLSRRRIILFPLRKEEEDTVPL